jgi:predicted NUDIX family NTP pyrophosphohydrolase
MGGPYWAKKEDFAWSIPKGEFDPHQEDPEAAARREFFEETGYQIDQALRALEPVTKNGKTLMFYMLELDIDPTRLRSNLFELEWPPKSGKMQFFAELDRFAWFDLEQAGIKLVKSQQPFLDQLSMISE